MATPKARGKRRGNNRAESAGRCFFCQLTGVLNRSLEKHSSVLKHLANARRETLEAVREFVDIELDSLEKVIQSRRKRGRRMTRIEVQE